MKILICPDSFKGTLTAEQASRSIEQGIKLAYPRAKIVLNPLADGGDGTLDVLSSEIDAKKIAKRVVDPLGREIDSYFLVTEDGTALIEMAKASGITLLEEKELDVMDATTYGTGQLIRAAIETGCKKIILFIGGSATNDCGIGMMQALGTKFFDKDGNDIGKECYLSAKHLSKIAKIESSKELVEIIIASDVDNVLYGKQGSVFTYGAQKGATKEIIQEIDDSVKSFSEIVKKESGIDVANIKGIGGAGGISVLLVAFMEAKIVSGIDMIAQLTSLEEKIIHSDIVITGEGRIDWQSLQGKAISGVIRLCKNHDKPLVAVGGSFGKDSKKLLDEGISFMMDAVEGKSFDMAYLSENADLMLKKVSAIAISEFLRQKQQTI